MEKRRSTVRHMIVVYQAVSLYSDYLATSPGEVVHMARCSCGWSVVNHLLQGVLDQVFAHRGQVA